jgi:hypothetical protein
MKSKSGSRLRATLLTLACASMVAALACEVRAAAIVKGSKCKPSCPILACNGTGNCKVQGDVGNVCTQADGSTAMGQTGVMKNTCVPTVPADSCTPTGSSLCYTTYNCYCTTSGTGVTCLVGGTAVITVNSTDCTP